MPIIINDRGTTNTSVSSASGFIDINQIANFSSPYVGFSAWEDEFCDLTFDELVDELGGAKKDYQVPAKVKALC